MSAELIALGRKLKRVRTARRLSRRFVAARTGVAAHHLEDIENAKGKRGPTADTLFRLASAYGVSLSKLLEGL